MKTLRAKILAVMAAVAVMFTLVAFGQVVRPLPVPAFWQAADGDYVGINSDGVFVARVGGTNFTGVSTLAPAASNLVIRAGIVVGVQDP